MNHHTIARSVRRSVVAGGISLGVLLAAGSPALAQTTTYGGTGNPPAGGTVTRPDTPQPATPVRGVTQTRSNQLPVTGGDVAGLAAVGAGLLAVGVVAVKGARRAPATA